MTEPAQQIAVTNDGPSQQIVVTPGVGPAEPAPAAAGSPLANLRQRRQARINKLFIDLQVPRWADDGGPPIYVRYAPTSPTYVADAFEERRKTAKTNKRWAFLANCDILIEACRGVYALVDGEKYSLREGDWGGEWTRFDPDLAACLGLDPATSQAVDVVQALYLTEGDLMAAAQYLGNWSEVVIPQAEEEHQGN